MAGGPSFDVTIQKGCGIGDFRKWPQKQSSIKSTLTLNVRGKNLLLNRVTIDLGLLKEFKAFSSNFRGLIFL